MTVWHLWHNSAVKYKYKYKFLREELSQMFENFIIAYLLGSINIWGWERRDSVEDKSSIAPHQKDP